MHLHQQLVKNHRITRVESGATLIIGLIMLLLLTIVGVAGTRETLLQEKMAGSSRDREIALQSAEAALRAGELQLQGVSPPVFNNEFGLYTTVPREDDDGNAMSEQAFWLAWSWTNLESIEYATPLENITTAPRYVIEQLDDALSADVGESTSSSSTVVTAVDLQSGEQIASGIVDYRVTALGRGLSGDSPVILQTTFRR